MAKRQISEIWNHYTSQDSHHAACNHCNAKISRGPEHYAVKNLTNSTLWTHLQRKHKEEWIKAKEVSDKIAEKKKEDKEEIEQR